MTVDDAIAASRATDASRVDEITDLFVAAGCHRARFASLAPFDRVLGALAWAVRAADGALDDVDADALYATMGERLRACEAIERALRDMGAPGALRAHQSGGLDADALRRTELEGNNLVLAASRAGAGVSMHPRAVVERDLKAGNLVVLWDEVDDNRGLGYYILTPRGADAAKVKVFLDWLGTQD